MTTKVSRADQIPVNIVGSSTFGVFSKISSEKTYNMYISDGWLLNFPGYQKILSIFPQGEGRGIFASVRGNFMIVVINQAVYQIGPFLAPLFIGDLATTAGEVFIDENLNQQICLVDGLNLYIYNWGQPPNLTVQAPVGGLVPNYVVYHNSFFLVGNGINNGNGASWYAFSFNTATTIQVTSTLALQTKPDFARAVTRIPGQSANVLVMGTSVCEIHTQVGGTLNYRRVNTISVDYGVLSVSTIDEADNYVAWLGVNDKNAPVLMVYTGQGAARISTDGIDYVLDRIKFPQESTASFIKVNGHLIYQLTFFNMADNLTLIYDFTTQKFFHLSDQYSNYHAARSYCYFNQATYFINLNNASLYQISQDFTTYNENILENPNPDPTLIFEIPRARITNTIAQADSDRFIVSRFTFTIEQGNDPNVTGASLYNIIPIITESIFNPPVTPMLTENGFFIVDEASWFGATSYTIPYQPAVDLSISQDGGYTWSSDVRHTLNPLGYRKNVLNWHRLGQSNYFTAKLRFWGLDRFVCNNGVIEVRK